MSRIARRRNASSTMLRSRVWSGSSIVSMLSASGADQSRASTTAARQQSPPSWRSVKVAAVLEHAATPSPVCVVIHTLPTIGNLHVNERPRRPQPRQAGRGIAEIVLAGEISSQCHGRSLPLLRAKS